MYVREMDSLCMWERGIVYVCEREIESLCMLEKGIESLCM